jgi:hypothetical protein
MDVIAADHIITYTDYILCNVSQLDNCTKEGLVHSSNGLFIALARRSEELQLTRGIRGRSQPPLHGGGRQRLETTENPIKMSHHHQGISLIYLISTTLSSACVTLHFPLY